MIAVAIVRVVQYFIHQIIIMVLVEHNWVTAIRAMIVQQIQILFNLLPILTHSLVAWQTAVQAPILTMFFPISTTILSLNPILTILATNFLVFTGLLQMSYLGQGVAIVIMMLIQLVQLYFSII